jgi:DNA-binding NtrC family response regulator
MAVILAIEDDAFILQELEWTLEDLGHRSLLASDLGGALGHLHASHPIDLLFVDIRLETLASGGYDVADQAIGLRPDLRVLYTSGSTLADDMIQRFVPGGRFLHKPYSPAQLGLVLGEMLNQRQDMPSPFH